MFWLFFETNYIFGKICRGDTEAEHKGHDLAYEKIQRANNKWNECRMTQIDFISQRLRPKNEVKEYIKIDV